MTTFQDIQAEHEALLKRQAAPDDPAQFWTDVQSFIDRTRVEAENISAPRERDQLRAILRFWASYVYDKTGSYPDTTLRPPTNEDRDVPPPPPVPTPQHHTPIVVWAIAALAVVAVVIALLSLVTAGGAAPMQALSTPTLEPTFALATRVQSQIEINAAMTVVVAASSTPTSPPTSTPTTTPTATPTTTPTPLPTATPTPQVVRPATLVPATPLPTQPPAQVVPLDVGYQILTQGPSPFDPAVWVIQLRLVGIGVNGVYIYWINGRQLPGDEYTVQGQRCETQAISLGVTSSGQAVKRDVTLVSPLAGCLRTGTP